MTGEEAAVILAASRKAQIATINSAGTPHLVAMYHVMEHRKVLPATA